MSATRPVPPAVLQRELDALTMHQITAAGMTPVAVRGWATVPARGQSPARAGKALVCRLYPNTPHTRLAFARTGQTCAEAVVFEDPDDQLAWNLKAGFENALYVVTALMHGETQ